MQMQCFWQVVKSRLLLKGEGTRLIYLPECKVKCLHRGPFCGSSWYTLHYCGRLVVVDKTTPDRGLFQGNIQVGHAEGSCYVKVNYAIMRGYKFQV